MDHKCNVIGFIGADKYDLILYLARILYHLQKRVLVIDLSESGALHACLRYPEGLKDTVIEHRGVYYLFGRKFNSDFLNPSYIKDLYDSAYDYVLIDFGFQKYQDPGCDRIIYVVDQQLQNIKRLYDISCMKKSLIVRDMTDYKIKPELIVCEAGLSDLAARNIYLTFHDEWDMGCKLNCQYNHRIRFNKLSVQLRKALKEIITDMVPGYSLNEVNKAYKKAAGGM